MQVALCLYVDKMQGTGLRGAYPEGPFPYGML
jgi:hypothetical protein